MVQILPQEQTLGSLFGTGLGTGIQTGLSSLINKFTEEQSMKKLSETLFGTSEQTGLTTDHTNQSQQLNNLKKYATDPKSRLTIAAYDKIHGTEIGSIIDKMYESGLKQQKIQSQQEIAKTKLAFQETKNTRENIDSAYKGAKETNLILARMKGIDKEGKTISPAMAALFDKLNMPISLLRDPNSEEFQKLSQQLMKGVTQYGNRILQVEFANFIKQIPTLLNSKEGRAKIIRNMELMNQINLDTYEAKKQILKENKGIPPMDLFDQIQERIAPKLDKIHEDMMSPIKKESKKFQKVEQGTPITEQIAKELLEAANGDIKKAEKAAKKLGYSF